MSYNHAHSFRRERRGAGQREVRFKRDLLLPCTLVFLFIAKVGQPDFFWRVHLHLFVPEGLIGGRFGAEAAEVGDLLITILRPIVRLHHDVPEQFKLEISGSRRRYRKYGLVRRRVFLLHGFCDSDYLEREKYWGEDWEHLNIR